jgi:hypothetical protein
MHGVDGEAHSKEHQMHKAVTALAVGTALMLSVSTLALAQGGGGGSRYGQLWHKWPDKQWNLGKRKAPERRQITYNGASPSHG